MIPSVAPPGYTDYSSEAENRSGRSFPGRFFPTFSFYQKIGRTIFACSGMAKRGEFDDDAWYQSSQKVIEAFEAAGASLSIEGTANRAAINGSCVIIGNHMSTAETFLLATPLLPFGRTTFVVKKALVEMPVFSSIMISRQPIVVGRENPKEDLRRVLEDGQDRLASGMSVVVFPQRTRSAVFKPAEFNSIGVKLAKKAGVPVLPMALKTDAWSNGKLFKDFGRFYPDRPVRFTFGEPLEVEGNGRGTNEKVIRFIREKLLSWDHPVEE